MGLIQREVWDFDHIGKPCESWLVRDGEDQEKNPGTYLRLWQVQVWWDQDCGW